MGKASSSNFFRTAGEKLKLMGVRVREIQKAHRHDRLVATSRERKKETRGRWKITEAAKKIRVKSDADTSTNNQRSMHSKVSKIIPKEAFKAKKMIKTPEMIITEKGIS